MVNFLYFPNLDYIPSVNTVYKISHSRMYMTSRGKKFKNYIATEADNQMNQREMYMYKNKVKLIIIFLLKIIEEMI